MIKQRVVVDGEAQRIYLAGIDVTDSLSFVEVSVGPDWVAHVTLHVAPGAVELKLPESVVAIQRTPLEVPKCHVEPERPWCHT